MAGEPAKLKPPSMPLEISQNKLIIDYGGTWVRLNLFHGKRKIHSLKVPSPSLTHLPALIEKSLKKWKINSLDQLLIGAKGVWKKSEKKALASKLKRFASKIIVLSDVEFTYNSIFGNKPGILLIAGTGSIAYGKDGKGHWARAGGLGHKIGDEGSGYWIGKEFLMQPKRAYLKDKTVRETASLTKGIIKKAEKGSPLETHIIEEAQKHLLNLVTTVSNKLCSKNKLPIALHGGLFQNSYFKKLFLLKNNPIVIAS